MFCNQCGTKLKDGTHYCVNCGARAGEETEGFLKPQLPEKEALKLQSKEDKKKRKKVVVAALLALSVIAVLTGAILMFFSPERRLARALDLGNKYLLEQDYEQAIVAFEKAIGIDPKCEDAYRGLADAYVGMDDYEAAIDILEQGIDKTDSRDLSAYLKKMKKTYARIQEETSKRDAEAAGQDMNTVEQTPEALAEQAEAAAEQDVNIAEPEPEASAEQAETAAEAVPEAPAEEAEQNAGAVGQDVNTAEQKPEAAGQNAGAGNWSEAYKNFVLGRLFLKEGNTDLGYDELFATFKLYDMDRNGVPELFIYNGWNGLAADYVFSYDGTSIRYCGDIWSPSYYCVTNYPGLFFWSYVGLDMLDWEDAEKYLSMGYLNHSTLKNYSVIKNRVEITGEPIDGSGEAVVFRTDDTELYNASQQMQSVSFRSMTLVEIEAQGWEAFVRTY